MEYDIGWRTVENFSDHTIPHQLTGEVLNNRTVCQNSCKVRTPLALSLRAVNEIHYLQISDFSSQSKKTWPPLTSLFVLYMYIMFVYTIHCLYHCLGIILFLYPNPLFWFCLSTHFLRHRYATDIQPISLLVFCTLQIVISWLMDLYNISNGFTSIKMPFKS